MFISGGHVPAARLETPALLTGAGVFFVPVGALARGRSRFFTRHENGGPKTAALSARWIAVYLSRCHTFPITGCSDSPSAPHVAETGQAEAEEGEGCGFGHSVVRCQCDFCKSNVRVAQPNAQGKIDGDAMIREGDVVLRQPQNSAGY